MNKAEIKKRRQEYQRKNIAYALIVLLVYNLIFTYVGSNSWIALLISVHSYIAYREGFIKGGRLMNKYWGEKIKGLPFMVLNDILNLKNKS